MGLCDGMQLCYLRNVRDKMADGKIAFEKSFGDNFDGPSIFFGTLVEYIRVSAKDKSRIHRLDPKGKEEYSQAMCFVREEVGQVTGLLQMTTIYKNQKPQKSTSKDSKTKKYLLKTMTNFPVQAELDNFLDHQQRRETLSEKMMMKSKKVTKRKVQQHIRDP